MALVVVAAKRRQSDVGVKMMAIRSRIPPLVVKCHQIRRANLNPREQAQLWNQT